MHEKPPKIDKAEVIPRDLQGSKETEPEAKEIVSSADEGIVNNVRKLINSKVAESRLPTEEGLGYKSTMGIYGGKLIKDEEGRLVYDTRGLWSKIDKWGDRLLRSFDEHHAKQPGKLAARHPLRFIKMLPLIVDSKRYRGTPEQTMENVKRFGLEDFYGPHPWGTEIKDPEAFSRLIGLQDIFRQDLINSEAISDIDRFDALGKAADYMKHLHETAGGIAEGNMYNFLFREKGEDHAVSNPLVIIPSEIYNPEKNISEIEKKATDFLDFLASAGTEEYRRSKDWTSVQSAMDISLKHYGDAKVIEMVISYIKRGRLTLPNDISSLGFKNSATFRTIRPALAAHNTQRLSVDPDITAQLRNEIINRCQVYLNSKNEDVPSPSTLS